MGSYHTTTHSLTRDDTFRESKIGHGHRIPGSGLEVNTEVAVGPADVIQPPFKLGQVAGEVWIDLEIRSHKILSWSRHDMGTLSTLPAL